MTFLFICFNPKTFAHCHHMNLISIKCLLGPIEMILFIYYSIYKVHSNEKFIIWISFFIEIMIVAMEFLWKAFCCSWWLLCYRNYVRNIEISLKYALKWFSAREMKWMASKWHLSGWIECSATIFNTTPLMDCPFKMLKIDKINEMIFKYINMYC